MLELEWVLNLITGDYTRFKKKDQDQRHTESGRYYQGYIYLPAQEHQALPPTSRN